MRKLNGFLYSCALVMMCSTANAQIKIIIDNQEIPTEDIKSIVILPNSNLISISTNVAYTVEAEDAPPSTPDAVKITSFGASPSTIESGESITVAWVTENATSCKVTGSVGQLQGSVDVNGSKTMVIKTVKLFEMKLTCEGPSGPVSRSAEIVVNAEGTTPPPTNNNCPASPLSGVSKKWADFWGVVFPGPGYSNKTFRLARSGYGALEFDTGDIVDDGLLVTVGNTVTSGVRLGAISECPGDFDVAPECDHVWGIGGGITWSTNGKAGACKLKPNTTYYINVTFTDGFDPTTSSCSTTNCISTIQHVNR